MTEQVTDPVADAATEVVGGPLGRYAADADAHARRLAARGRATHPSDRANDPRPEVSTESRRESGTEIGPEIGTQPDRGAGAGSGSESGEPSGKTSANSPDSTDRAPSPSGSGRTTAASGTADPASVPSPWRNGYRWRVAALLTALSGFSVLLGGLLRVPCIKTGWWPSGGRAGDRFWNMCYSDLPETFRNGQLDHGLDVFFRGGGAPSGQPPVTGFLLSLIGSITPDRPTMTGDVRWNFALWAVLLVLLLAVLIVIVAFTARSPWAAAHVALSPVIVLMLFVSADLVGVVLATAGMVAWGRSRPALAGVLLGLAIGARTYPVLILVAIGLLALRAGRLPAFGRTAGAAALTVAVIFGGVWLINPDAAFSSYQAWAASGAGYGSPWLLPQLSGHAIPAGVVTALAVLGWVIAVLSGAYLALTSARRPTVAEISLVMVGIVLITGKSFTVQSSLWLLPLIAFAAVTWRDHLVWAAGEVLNFGAVWLALAATIVPDRGLPNGWYSLILLTRVGATIWLIGVVWLHIRDRWSDRDKRLEADDLAGPLRGAEDQLIVRFA